MDRPKIDYTPLGVFVPADDSRTMLRPGTGIVGAPEPLRTHIYHEDNTDYANVNTFADLLHIAWGRCSQNYPTHKRQLVDSDDVIQVGIYDPRNGDLIVDPDQRELLMRWLNIEPGAAGADEALERESHATQANHEQRREIRKALAEHTHPRQVIEQYARRHGHDDLLEGNGA
jgi:hypothetical protein